jgi:hypothetical protein
MLGMDADEIALTVALQIAIACLMAVIATSFWRQGKHMEWAIDAQNDNHSRSVFDGVPELPSAGQRWTVRRKASVVEAVRGGWMPIEEACRLYNISVDEFLAWERDIDRNGIPGLRATRYQIYRDTERKVG